MSYNGAMNKENLERYLQVEQRPFGEAPLTDVDLMAFAALIYAEFERFPLVYDEAASIPIGDMPRYGTPWEYVEHDCHPKGMLPFVEALFANPRFTGIPLQRFRCIVDEERGVQFGAGCFPLTDGRVVVAYRGTNTLLVGWQENIDLIWQVEGPGEAEALRYFVEAAAAYPNASFIVCGHSKGGGLADHVAVYAPNELLPRFAARIRGAMPAFSSVVVAVIVAAVVAASAARIRDSAALVALAVVLHNALGMGLGWCAGRLFRMDGARRRTLAIEVGMQNSGLAVSLATVHFAAMPLAAVPGALFSVWHNLSGALYANLCARRDAVRPG